MAPPLTLTGKVVVVTGGSRGIGLGLVKQLLRKPGNTVVATTREPKTAQHLLDLQAQAGPSLLITQLDTTSEASVKLWAHQLHAQVAVLSSHSHTHTHTHTHIAPHHMLIKK